MGDDHGDYGRRQVLGLAGSAIIGAILGGGAAEAGTATSLGAGADAGTDRAVMLLGPDGRPLPKFTPSDPGYVEWTGRTSLGTLCDGKRVAGVQPAVGANGEAALVDVQCSGAFAGTIYGRKTSLHPWRRLICTRLDDGSLRITAGAIAAAGTYEVDISGFNEVHFDLTAADGVNPVTVA